MSFNRIKEDHFKNINWTPKQIIDIYNAWNGTSRQEQNLVFVETNIQFLNSFNTTFLMNPNEICVLHYLVSGHNSAWKIGFSDPVLNTRQTHATIGERNNLLFGSLLWHSGDQIIVYYTKFKVV
jgi:hypothetical protein